MSIPTAIANLKLLSFTYEGYSRVVEPHTYGIDAKGHRALRAYQVSGGSSSGTPEGWRMFHEREMRNVTVLAEGFSGPRPKYKRGDSQFRSIVAQL
jgi:hypothetical protein